MSYAPGLFEFVSEHLKFCAPKDSDVSIVIDKDPIKGNYNKYTGRVLYISVTDVDGKVTRLYPNKLNKLKLSRIQFGIKPRFFSVGTKNPFWLRLKVNEMSYEGYQYFPFELASLSSSDSKMISKLKEKYDIKDVEVFHGLYQSISLPDDDVDNEGKIEDDDDESYI